MNKDLQLECDYFIDNYNAVKELDALGSDYCRLMCAMELTIRNELADFEKIKGNIEDIKSNFGIFSVFRGNLRDYIATKLCFVNNELYLQAVKDVYDEFGKKLKNDYHLLASMIVFDGTVDGYEKYMVEQAVRIHKAITKDHFWRSTNELISYSALLALSEKDNDELIRDVNECYEILKQKYPLRIETLTIATILALSELPAEEKCTRLFELSDYVKENKLDYKVNDCLDILASIIKTDITNDKLIEEVMEVSEYLKNYKPFRGLLGMAKNVRYLIATALVMDVEMPIPEVQTIIATSVLTKLIAAQAAAAAAAA